MRGSLRGSLKGTSPSSVPRSASWGSAKSPQFLPCFSTSSPRYPCPCFGGEGGGRPIEVPVFSGPLAHVPHFSFGVSTQPALCWAVPWACKGRPSPRPSGLPRDLQPAFRLWGLCILEQKAMGTQIWTQEGRSEVRGVEISPRPIRSPG